MAPVNMVNHTPPHASHLRGKSQNGHQVKQYLNHHHHQQQNQTNPTSNQHLHPSINSSQSQPTRTNVNLQRHKSIRKSLYQTHKSMASSSAYSPPPLGRLRSKQSKSIRIDPYEVPPITCCDYLWLLVYYIFLYAFLSVFWFSLWLVYMSTTPNGQPRYPHRHKMASYGLSFDQCNSWGQSSDLDFGSENIDL